MCQRGCALALILLVLGTCPLLAEDKPRSAGPTDQGFLLPNGWTISPAGRQVELGGLPLKLTLLSGGRYLLVTSNGYTQPFLAVIDMETEKVTQRLPIAQGWLGLAARADGQSVSASAGSEDRILVYRFAEGKLTPAPAIPLTKGTFPAGLATNRKGDRLFVTGNTSHSLDVLELPTHARLARIPVGVKPYACVLSADEQTAYVSNWGEDTVAVVDLAEAKVVRNLRVQEHPNDLVLSADQGRLFVANGNRNTVSVIDTRACAVIEQIDVALLPQAPPGSTPNALALSADGRTLYVANADNNAIAVLDVQKKGQSKARGFIPSGWYPTALALAGKKLVIANGKGSVSKPNATLWKGFDGDERTNPGYLPNLLEGTLAFVDLPDERALARYSEQAHRNSPYGKENPAARKAPFALGADCPLQHIVYIIKENRTYDQVFGDMKEGNGDPRYCLFPEKITPNHHALARQFVLFDNFYHDAEVSADGHHWVTSAYATDYVEKLWPSPGLARTNPDRGEEHGPGVWSAAVPGAGSR